ncbi:MAG: hypothetical protein AB2805_05700 [Candidatus Thiodiazotropha sp.]
MMIVTPASQLHSEEITPFRITDTEGFVAARYTLDENRYVSTEGDVSWEKRPIWEEEIAVASNGYIYHPKLVEFKLGGGILFQQSRFESSTAEASDNDIHYSLSAKLDFLKEKPYPFSLFYERRHPSMSLGPTGRFLTENTYYGAHFSLREPISPVLLNLTASHSETTGQGLDQILDDTIDQLTFHAHRTFGPGNFAQFVFNTNRQDSKSGSINLPIQPSSNDTDSASLHSRFLFGDKEQITWTNVVNYTTQSTRIGSSDFPDRTRFDFLPDVRWKHSDKLDSFYRYSYRSTEQGPVDNTSESLVAGLNFRPYKTLTGTADVHIEDESSSGKTRDLYGVKGNITYRPEIPHGTLQLSYGVKYDLSDRRSDEVLVPAIGERVTLEGTTSTALNNEFIVAGSIEVSNLNRTQSYVEGLDYRLISVGSEVQIQRILTGNITDGQTVLVDYEYEAGGTFKHTLLDQNLQVNATFFRHLNLFARFRDQSIDVTDGQPSVPVNPVQKITYGGRLDVPFNGGWSAGFSATIEDQDEEVSPFYRENYDAYIQIPLPFVSSLRLSARKDKVDNERSDEDVDLTGYSLLIQSRPFNRTILKLLSSFEEDVGGTLPRETWRSSLSVEWRLRHFRISLQARHTRNEQGTVEQERTDVLLLLKRDFDL